MLRIFACFVCVLGFYSLSVSAYAACTNCPQLYCENPEAARQAIERKKTNARNQGLPERLVALFDRLPPCLGCIEKTPDWVNISWRVDEDAYEEDRGREPGYGTRSMLWSADIEKKVRDDMRRGVITEYHIFHYDGPPCKCCNDTSEDSVSEWREELDASGEDLDGYNEDFDFHPDTGIGYTDPDTLGKDPKDLTEIPEAFRRADTLKAPPIEEFMDPAVRVVQVSCKDCQELADRYNALGEKINTMRTPIAEMKRDLVYDRQLISAVWREIEGIGRAAYTPENAKREKALFEELGGHQRAYDRHKKRLDEKLTERAELELQLSETMSQLKICEETGCKPVKDERVSCPAPGTTESITVGPNNKVGSGAAMKNKVKDQAKGMAMGAIGGLMGGGMGFGGGGDDFDGIGSPGGGGGQKGPKTVKDPSKGDFAKFLDKAPGLEHVAGVEAGGRFIMVGDDELLSSIKLEDVPGDGTFHAIWLEDSQGNIIMPTRYLIFDLYRDWKLTVWWTYDRWVDGEHVESRKGREVTYGRDELGSFLVKLEGLKSIANSVWYSLGFETAVKGINHIGAVFPVSPADLAKDPCGYRLVVHVALPDKDPVVTQPLVLDVPKTIGVSKSGGGKPEAKPKAEKKNTRRIRDRD